MSKLEPGMLILIALAVDENVEHNQFLSYFADFADAYYSLSEYGAELALCSPLGGSPFPFRVPTPTPGENSSRSKFHGDRVARDHLSDTLAIDQIFPSDFDALYCIGAKEDVAELKLGGAPLLALFALQRKPIAVVGGEFSYLWHPGAGIEPSIVLHAGSSGKTALEEFKEILTALSRPYVYH